MRLTYFVFSIILMLTIYAGAAETELYPIMDAYVCDCAPNTTNPNGTVNDLYHGDIGICFCQTFIQWDLSSLSGGLTITDAKMLLYCISLTGSPNGSSAFYRITEVWDETSVTHSNQPAHHDSTPVISSWPAVGEWFEIDITGFVQGWYDGSFDNFGVYCHCKDTTNTVCPRYPSSNSSDSQYWPRLTITYTGSAVDAESIGVIKSVYK